MGPVHPIGEEEQEITTSHWRGRKNPKKSEEKSEEQQSEKQPRTGTSESEKTTNQPRTGTSEPEKKPASGPQEPGKEQVEETLKLPLPMTFHAMPGDAFVTSGPTPRLHDNDEPVTSAGKGEDLGSCQGWQQSRGSSDL